MSRIDMWYTGIQYLKQDPILGRGYEMFRWSYGRPAHNGYVSVFADTGLVGFFLWTGLLFLGIRDAGRLRSLRGQLGEYAGALRVSLLAYCGAAVFANVQFTIIQFIPLAILAALWRIGEERRLEEEPEDLSPWESDSLVLEGAQIGVVVVLIFGFLHSVIRFST